MEVIYYLDSDLGIAPVKKFLEKYIKNEKRVRLLTDIRRKIEYVRGRNGIPSPPISMPLIGYSFFEIKAREDSNSVIRILYARYQEKMVLLNAFEKPDHYETTKIRRNIEKHYNLTNQYLKKFISKPKNYEKYE